MRYEDVGWHCQGLGARIRNDRDEGRERLTKKAKEAALGSEDEWSPSFK